MNTNKNNINKVDLICCGPSVKFTVGVCHRSGQSCQANPSVVEIFPLHKYIGSLSFSTKKS